MAKGGKKVDGGAVLYHYLQHSLQQDDIWLFQMLVAKLVVSLGVWFPVETYRRLPITLPFVVRDPKSRRPVDQWGAPDESGFFRDDNTMIKNLRSSLVVSSSAFSGYRGHKLGKGFIAAHVWRETTNGKLASRIASTNSFIPNLVWLPSNVAKLTDIEGSFAQTYVQAIASMIYRDEQLTPELQPFVDDAWALLPENSEFPDHALPGTDELNFFEPSEQFITRNVARIRTIAQGLEDTSRGRQPDGKVVSSRYTEGLPKVAPRTASNLANQLTRYCEAVDAST